MKKRNLLFSAIVSMLFWWSCSAPPPPPKPATGTLSLQDYFAPHDTGMQTGGVKVIPIHTPAGDFKVWTQRVGNNPKMKVLLLHGGPGATHEYFECVQSFFPREGIEFIFYDQLGSGNSDHPEGKGDLLWEVPRFVEEVEQVRQALKLDADNFYLLGSSWGGILAMEYALKYQQHLKGLIITNMMSSAPEYDRYANEVLAKQMDPAVLKEIRDIEARGDFDNPRYMELLLPHFYTQHLIRLPLDQWPDAINRTFAKLNSEVYVTMQGPSEFGISGKLETWDVSDRLPEIEVPTLTIGATYDTMDPKHMEWMSTQVKKGRFLLCPKGSHFCMWDDQETWMNGVMKFIHDVNEGQF
ncbi:MAG: alpha/beta fold hydrolase [Bacteroidetes bacterium]|nr:MAG: alpha/beta fold hydrolase [Bacteroidota bacterium]